MNIFDPNLPFWREFFEGDAVYQIAYVAIVALTINVVINFKLRLPMLSRWFIATYCVVLACSIAFIQIINWLWRM
jgi:hypothetical protein